MDEGLRERRRDTIRCGMSVFLYRIDMDGGLLDVERATSNLFSSVRLKEELFQKTRLVSFHPAGKTGGKHESADGERYAHVK